jgi:hypothetical protein
VTITAIAPPDIGRHAAAIKGMANLSAFLQTHPALPLAADWSGDPFTVFVLGGTDEQNRAEVDRIAAILGVPAEWMRGSRRHYSAVRRFGGGITYRALAIDSSYKTASAGIPAGSEAAA